MSCKSEHDSHHRHSGGWSVDVLYLSSFLGEVQIEQCDKCAYRIVQCNHKYKSWNIEQTQLTCDLCGTDVT